MIEGVIRSEFIIPINFKLKIGFNLGALICIFFSNLNIKFVLYVYFNTIVLHVVAVVHLTHTTASVTISKIFEI